jgi:hypothetical protein
MLFELFIAYTVKDAIDRVSKRLEEEQARKERASRRTVKKYPKKQQK